MFILIILVGNKKKTRNNVIDLSNSYIPTHKSTKSNGIVTSGLNWL